MQHIANPFANTTINYAVGGAPLEPVEQEIEDNVVVEEHVVSDDGGNDLQPRGEPEKQP